MKWTNRPVRMGFLLAGLIAVCGGAFMYSGNDAVVLAKAQKDGILTAEQVKVSFDTVSGRLLREAVKEGDHVKKGDVLMVMDSTDIDLSIEKTEAQIAQMDAQIAQMEETIRLGYSSADTTEIETFRQIDQQRQNAAAAEATYENKKLDYDRKAQLVDVGAISLSEMDSVRTDLETARANAAAQREALAKLLGGAADTGDTDSLVLPSIVNARGNVQNKENDLEALRQQKKQLEVALKTLQVNKNRLVLTAPEDGKILKVIAKEGEMISPSAPVILLESERYYYDIYLDEAQTAPLREGDSVKGRAVAGGQTVDGTIRLIAKAPGFADYKMSREKGQADLSAFQVRIYTKPEHGVIPGMTIEVKTNELGKR